MVRDKVRFQDHFVISRRTGCWLWTGGTTGAGYGQFWRDGGVISAHRVAAGAKPGQVVRHTCDVKRCVNPDHLRIGTHKENTADLYARGRHRRSNYKMTIEGREEARRLRRLGMPLRAIGERLGVSAVRISVICRK